MSSEQESATRLDAAATLGALTPTPSAFDEGGFAPGTLLQGRYRIVALIGRGGMGEVYRAQDLKLGQTVALKFLPPDVQRDSTRLERFLSEVRIARQISHPNVCRVYDVGEIEGHHFLSMEFVDGEDLASLLRRIGRLPADKGVEIARQVCAGLAAAHDRGVLHRDLKPANIMIDGRGQARLADFGLAAAGGGVRAGEIAGTPAYMAPEQLEGQELSTKADIYALGLVLHELFTGKRVFEDASVQELREQHRSRSGTRSTITSSGVELDPAIDRAIRRCLEADPRNRPPSALAVAAALPGGDPLAAALAAGETPSPELVAQAGAEGTLAPAVASGLIAAFVVGLVATAWFGDQLRIFRLLRGMRSPEVLAARAEDLLDTMGYGAARADHVYGVRRNLALVGYVVSNDRASDRWERVVASDAPAVQFWYRQSPAPLVPYESLRRVTLDDPPVIMPGMAQVELTGRSRLVSFRAVPQERIQSEPAGAPDWSTLFKAAGVDASALTSVSPSRRPPDYADTIAAWEGRYPGRPDWDVRIEAAAYRGQPVWFVVAGPWDRSPGPDQLQADTRDVFARVADTSQVSLQVIALVAGAVLALRNTRAGRADQRGGRIVAVCTGVALIAWLALAHHYAGTVATAWQRFLAQLAMALFWSVMVWLDYLALEPFVRRRWPEAMISWTRLLAGRVRDPLVARDILIGCVGGFAIVVLGDALAMAPGWFGQPPPPQVGGSIMRSLGPVAVFASELARRPSRLLLESMLMLFLILLSHAVLRNRWLATAVVIATYGAIVFNRAAPIYSVLFPIILVGILVILVSRFGVLAYASAWFVVLTVLDLPLSLDTSAWYAARTAITAGMLLVIAGWAFYRSLGGRSPFGAAFD